MNCLCEYRLIFWHYKKIQMDLIWTCFHDNGNSRPNGHELEQTLGEGEEQGSLECCNLCGCKESNRTEVLVSDNKVTVYVAVFPGVALMRSLDLTEWKSENKMKFPNVNVKSSSFLPMMTLIMSPLYWLMEEWDEKVMQKILSLHRKTACIVEKRSIS